MDNTLKQEGGKWGGVVAISILMAIAYLPLLGYLPLHLEEPRRAIIAVEMLASGNYFTPVHAGQIYLGKPPLFNWLICAASLPFGSVSAWSARLPSVLALWILTTLLVASTLHRLGPTVALFWSCAILLSPEILIKGQLAEIDVVFTCLVTGSLWSWWLLDQAKQRGVLLWLPPLLLTTLAFLTKREPALVFFYLTIAPYLIVQKRGLELLKPAHLLAVLLAAIPIIAWLAAMAAQVGWEALWQSLLHETLQRGEGKGLDRYVAHVLTYPLQIMLASAPFSLLILPLGITAYRSAVWQRHGNLALFAAVAVLANLPLYWFKGHLAVRYFLPMFPLLLLLAALSYETLLNKPSIAGLKCQRLIDTITLRTYWNKHYPKQALLALMVIVMLLLRVTEFVVYLPLKAQYLAQTQNATAILEDIIPRLQPGRPLFVSQRIHSAIWFYAPANLLYLIDTNAAKLIGGDLLLRHKTVELPQLSLTEIARYRYENDDLSLEMQNVD